ncbi:hypothetical protein MUCCIDRAFT_166865 [Mucor lusitanicus CBS 277.49]|uniref:FHA domain-containing protein n=1 Tax=Mucor lusitanicus CBS 277.49 TaxID=747725 RepID=A0A162YMB9_MUCCL|nr:hypothetical protein MUCCIDRAFT_166865 [Mucor lusitanicus CBS 277.49]
MEKELIGVLRGSNNNTQDFVFSILEDHLYRIGKDDNSDIRINIEDFICDTHCVIASSAPGSQNNNVPNVYLTDTSTTGTFLNGYLIGQNNTVLLYSGCIITFASKHINLQYIQYSPEDEHFPAFTMTVQPGYLGSPFQQVDTSREITLQTTSTEIGFGNQSYILLAYDTRNPNRQLACKYTNLKKSHLEPWLMRAYETELKILKSNTHPNVLSLVAYYENQQQKFVFLPIIYITKTSYIAPANILLADRYTDRPRLVIADFGHSMYQANKPETWPDDWGTLAYRSPEMVKLQEFSEKVDCWAAGIIFYQLLVGELPFSGPGTKDLEEAILVKSSRTSLTRTNIKEQQSSNFYSSIIASAYRNISSEKYTFSRV